jgi:RND family efflux transporter MFP subunit
MHIANPPKPDTGPSSTEDSQMRLAELRARRDKKRLMMAGGAVAVIVAGFALNTLLTPPPSVRVTTIKEQATERVLAVTGRVKPRESVQVFPKVAGQIVALNKDEGDLVKAGEVLGRVDPARAQSALNQAAAALDAQRRILGQAERDLERARTLLERGSSTVAAVEAATLAVTKGREDVRRLEAARDEAKLRLDEYTITAPFDGRVLNRPVDPGQVVDLRTAMFDVAPVGAQEVETEVDEAYSMSLKLGQPARMSFAGIPTPIEGKVSYLAPEIQTSTGGRVVRLSFDAPQTANGTELPVGLSVDVNIIVDRAPEALTVPRQSIRDIATAPYVLTVKDGKLAKQSISFIDWPAQSVIVTDGLKPGDQVVVSPKTPEIGAKVKAEG